MSIFKNTFLLLWLLTLVSNTLAFSQRLSSEDFRSFSKSQKIDFIKQSQDFMVQWEQLQIERYRKQNKFKTVQLLLESLVPKAYAQQIATHKHLCVYAGWLSYIPKNKKGNQKGSCRHPSQTRESEIPAELKDVILAENTRYKATTKGSGCNNPTDIICNDQLFGKKENGKPYCVVGNSDSKNSSYSCLKMFHEDEERNLDYIIEQNLSDEGSERRLERLMGMIDDACMCDGPSNLIDQDYANRMFKTQTCFAWIAQTRNIAKRACSLENEDEKDNVEKFIDLSKRLHQKANDELIKAGITADKYTELIQKDRQWTSADWTRHRKNYEEFCKADPELLVTGKDHDDKTLFVVTATPKGIPNFDPKNLRFEIPYGTIADGDNIKQTPSVKVLKKQAEPYDVKVTYDHLSGTVTVPKLEAEPSNQFKIVPNLTTEGVYELTAVPTLLDGCEPIKITWKIIDNDDLELKVDKLLKDDNKELPEVVSVEQAKIKKEETVEAILDFNCKDGKPQQLKDIAKLAPAEEIDDSFKHKIKIAKDQLKGNEQYFLATVSLDDKSLTEEELKEEKFKIYWFVKEAGKEKETKEKKEKEIIDEDGDGIPDNVSDDETTQGDGVGDEEEKNVRLIKIDGFKHFSTTDTLKSGALKLSSKKQTVQALLVKEDSEDDKKSNTVDIEPKKTGPVQGPQMPGGFRPSTGRNIILRGVR